MSEVALRRDSIHIASEKDLAALVALAGLPSLTPRRLWSLIDLGSPSTVWQRVCAGGAPSNGRGRDPAIGWPGWSNLVDPERLLDQHRHGGVAVLPYGHPGYPNALLEDPDPPAVIFRQGPTELDDRVRVAIVGTRRCSRYGRSIAYELGAALANRGVDVVSGLATGIDAAAHAGVAATAQDRMVAVVAGGVDVMYPKRNQGLYRVVAEHGALLSEWPLGSTPNRWRFPARNRLVAALSAAVVVVESPEKGGSMYTVDEALRRDRAVFAVPGSIRSPVSAGTNKLIAEGAYPLNSIDHLVESVAPECGPRPVQASLGIDSWLLEMIGWEPVDLDSVVDECGRTPSEVTLEVERLIGSGSIHRLGGLIERVR